MKKILNIFIAVILTAIVSNTALALPSDRGIINGVIKEFEGFSTIPHCTFNEKEITEYLVKELKSMGASVEVDSANNIIADIPATKGFENAPLTIIQGHTDMVCAHTDDFDPVRNSIKIVVDKNILKTDGHSSLGADCGFNNAGLLWLFRTQKFDHGKIRFLLTSSEEVGLVGAKKLDAKYLEGAKYLINLDGFHIGRIVTGSAGGRRVQYIHKNEYETPKYDTAYEIKLSNLKGGHSGYDINKNRANAIKYLAYALMIIDRDLTPCGQAGEDLNIELASISGGENHNVIPRESKAVVLVNKDNEEIFLSRVKKAQEILSQYNCETGKNDLAKEDRGLRVTAEKTSVPEKVFSDDTKDDVILFLAEFYNGKYKFMKMYPNLVDTSSNLGLIKTTEDAVVCTLMMRFNEEEYKSQLREKQNEVAKTFDFDENLLVEYGAWKPVENNPLVEIFRKSYKKVTGKNATCTAEHIGLEPSALLEKNPNLLIISTGCTIHNAHSVSESGDITTIPPYVKMMKNAIEEIAKEK